MTRSARRRHLRADPSKAENSLTELMSSRTIGVLAACALISTALFLRKNNRFSLESLDDQSSTLSSIAQSHFSEAKWLAKERGLKFSREDDLAKSYLPRTQPIDEVLGDLSSPDFEIKEVGI